MGESGLLPYRIHWIESKKSHRLPGIELEGIFTHFAEADGMGPEFYNAAAHSVQIIYKRSGEKKYYDPGEALRQ